MYSRQGDDDQPDENGWIGEEKQVVCVQGVDGKCGVKGFEHGIEVMSFSWNLARQAPESRLPARIRQAQYQYQKAEDKKERAVLGLPSEEEEEKAAAEKKKQNSKKDDAAAVPVDSSSSASTVAPAADAPLVEPELKFDDSEVEPRSSTFLHKPHVGGFNLTKYSDWSSPQLYQLQLSQRRGIEVTFQVVRERVKNFVPKVLTPEEKAKAAAKAQRQQQRGFGGFGAPRDYDEEEAEEQPEKADEPPVEKEVVIKQQWVLQDAFLTNISISGGSGGQPVETLSINFESFQYKYVDYPRSDRNGRRGGRRPAPAAAAAADAASSSSAPPKVPELSIIYDGLRQVAQRYDTAVNAELNKNHQLRPTASVVLEYL